MLAFIEAEALQDVTKINISQDQEGSINIEIVNDWYVETEKLIRILANTLPSTMAQPINQLRYAGHHILKFATSSSEESKHSNLIEAYKHCKRGYYDAIDLYVFHTNKTFKEKFAYLPKNVVSQHSQTLEKHIKEIDSGRLTSECRIEYYSGVAMSITNGLSIINAVNLSMSESGITDEFLIAQKKIIVENNELKQILDVKLDEADRKFNKFAVQLTIVIALATFIGLFFDGFAAQWFLTSNIELNVTDAPIIEYRDLDKITSK